MYSCAGVKTFKVLSEPSKAKVSYFESSQKTYLPLGESPVILDKKKIESLKGFGKDFLILRVQKSGYAVENLIIDTTTKNNIDYLLKLKPLESWANKEASSSSRLANNIARNVQNINRDILAKDLSEALKKTNKLIDQYPKANVFFDIKGSIFLLKGEENKALASFKKSLSLEPDNIETQKVIQVLEKKRGP